MKIKNLLLPKSKLGKYSLYFILSFFVFLGIFFLFILSGQRGGMTFFSNLYLTIPFLIAIISGVISFITGVISFIKNKEHSLLVIASTILGFLITLFMSLELLFPH